ncbi:glycosyl hydrolase family 61-domain-containing protein [Staphylotrichum tortipilum]|uniref:lytic cellulose monooxygenase (C4-dehydrogenating) n=1 Tax=Staphylotrichum tortipilum TaxID=2831512 RepID=A0AAN6RWL6_9PEZI|nr:glycosyl hydrolase family 61-domain-containing protein [Staphylotrichum longicolle]
MYLSAATLALAFASGASAHAHMYGVWVNGVDQGDGRNAYIRSPPNNSPVKDLASPDLACNVNGGKAVGSFVKAAAGDKLTFEWYHDSRSDDIIAESHHGPIITYIAQYTETNGASSIWTKIAEDGYDASTKKWAVDKLITNKGKQDFVLPATLAAGRYIIRQEIIAHHESDTAFNANPARGAQFYPSCVQFEVTGAGSAVPDQDFNFNTGYTYADPGIVFNIYAPFTSYSIPGPAVWSGAGSSPATKTPTPATTTSAPVIAGPTLIPGESETPTATSAPPAAVTTSASAAPVVTTPATTAAPTTLVTVTGSATKPRPTGKGKGKCGGGRRRRRAARAAAAKKHL